MLVTLHGWFTITITAMIGENRQKVMNEPVEFENNRLNLKGCMKITDPLREIYKNMPQFDKGKPEDVNM